MNIDWAALFEVGSYPLEMFIRGTVMYWFIFIMLRLAGRRDFGSVGVADLLVFMLIADAAGNAMTGESTSLPSGMVIVATMLFWTVLIDRVAYFFPAVEKWLEPKKILLIRNGVIQHRGLRHEYITRTELMSELRAHGLDDVRQVRRAYIESDGKITILTRDETPR